MVDELSRWLMRASPNAGFPTPPLSALSYAYCCPRSPVLVAKARSLWPNAALFKLPEPGETLLAAVAGNGGSLWVLKPRACEPYDGELAKSCQDQLECARRIVSRELGLISDPRGPQAWTVVPIKARQDTVLRGDSFGLSFCLAMASAMLHLELPADLAASAGVRADGSLHPVEGLNSKLEVLTAWAPGVRCFLVTPEQEAQARELAASMGAAVEVVGVDSLASAISVAFPNLVERAARHWTDPAARQRVTQRLFYQTVERSASLLRYEGVANACEHLGPFAVDGSNEARMLEFTRIVARGHDSSEEPLPLHEAWLSGMRAPIRKRVLAHVVSRSLYAVAADRQRILEYAERALSHDPQDDSPEDLEVLGAVGRVLAPLGEYERALGSLRRALDGWLELRHWAAASYALSEVVRITGVALGVVELEQLIGARVLPLLASGELDEVGRAFVVFAVARAWAQLANPAKCLHWMREVAAQHGADFDHTPPHLEASRLRWELVAAARLNDPKAALLKTSLQALANGRHRRDTEFAWVLAQLDEILATDRSTDLTQCLERFRELEPKAFELATALSVTSTAADRARALTRHYPY